MQRLCVGYAKGERSGCYGKLYQSRCFEAASWTKPLFDAMGIQSRRVLKVGVSRHFDKHSPEKNGFLECRRNIEENDERLMTRFFRDRCRSNWYVCVLDRIRRPELMRVGIALPWAFETVFWRFGVDGHGDGSWRVQEGFSYRVKSEGSGDEDSNFVLGTHS